MTKLHPPFARADMPPGIAALPLNDRGYPIPWFVAPPDKTGGKVDFRIMDGDKFVLAIKERLCWVCGQPLRQVMAFVIGPMCCINRTGSEPPAHPECGRWSARACPFLSTPGRIRDTADLPATRIEVGGMIKRNPGVTAVWWCHGYKPFQAENGFLLEIGDPVRVQWFAEGRQATRAEIMHSIETGLPSLVAAALKDPEPIPAVFELGRATERAMWLLPPESDRGAPLAPSPPTSLIRI